MGKKFNLTTPLLRRDYERAAEIIREHALHLEVSRGEAMRADIRALAKRFWMRAKRMAQ